MNERDPRPQPEYLSLDQLKDRALNRIQGGRVDPLDKIAEEQDQVEQILNRRDAKLIKNERESIQGRTDEAIEAEADTWLRNAGFDDLTDAKLK